MLIDRQIREALTSGELTVDPADSIDSRIQPASLDVRLGTRFLDLDTRAVPMIDPREDQRFGWVESTVDDGHFYTLHPGELVLACTLEAVELSDSLVARVEGKSSLGRLGLLVHATAGYIDPGWQLATITLELSSVVGVPIRLYSGMPIAQLAFERVEAVSAVYSGKYTGQKGPTPSAFHRNWTGSAWT